MLSILSGVDVTQHLQRKNDPQSMTLWKLMTLSIPEFQMNTFICQ